MIRIFSIPDKAFGEYCFVTRVYTEVEIIGSQILFD